MQNISSPNLPDLPIEVGSNLAYKHWALVLEFFKTGTLEPEVCEIWEGVRTGDGQLMAQNKPLALSKWAEYKGEDKLEIDIVDFDRDAATAFCKEFNNRNLNYIAFEENCQTFVEELVVEIGISSCLDLPTQAKENKSFWEGVSVGSSGLATRLVARSPVFLDDALIWLQSQVAGKPLEKLLIISSSELKKKMINALNGAASWWQLLQIPVEILTKNMLEQVGYDDIEAYGGSKLASFITASGVGNIIVPGGPGLVASIALWVSLELLAFLIRKGLEKATGGKCNLIFGESKTEQLVFRIYKWIRQIMHGAKQRLGEAFKELSYMNERNLVLLS